MCSALLLLMYGRKKRMTLTATVTSINYLPNGSVMVAWSDGTENEFPNRESIAAFSAAIDDPNVIKQMMVRAWLHRSPTGDDPAWLLGKTGQFDLSLELNQLSFGVQ